MVEVELGEPCQHRHGGAWLKESKLDPVPRQCPDADGRPRMRSSGACAGCFRPGAWSVTSVVDGMGSVMWERMCLDFGRARDRRTDPHKDARTHAQDRPDTPRQVRHDDTPVRRKPLTGAHVKTGRLGLDRLPVPLDTGNVHVHTYILTSSMFRGGSHGEYKV